VKLHFDAPLFRHLLDQQPAGGACWDLIFFSFAFRNSQPDSHQPAVLLIHACGVARTFFYFIFDTTRHASGAAS